MVAIVILNDGETFSHASGCRVVEVPNDWSVQDIELALAGEDDEGRLDLGQTQVIIADIEFAVEPPLEEEEK